MQRRIGGGGGGGGSGAGCEEKGRHEEEEGAACVDIDAVFRPVPHFLTEGFMVCTKRAEHLLQVLVRDVPTTSGGHDIVRKLQAHGLPGIAKQVRAVHAQEEAFRCREGHRPGSRPGSRSRGPNRSALPCLPASPSMPAIGTALRIENSRSRLCPPSSASSTASFSTTPGTSRPGTRQSMSLRHATLTAIAKLGHQLCENPSAINILTESRPRPAERDRPMATARVEKWASPRRSAGFIHLFGKALQASRDRVVVNTDQLAWELSLLAHQEERGTHALGDVFTLRESTKALLADKAECFEALDRKIRALSAQAHLARTSMGMERNFEWQLQSAWQAHEGVAHGDRTAVLETELARLQKLLPTIEANNRAEMEAIQKRRRRAKRNIHEEQSERSAALAVKDAELQAAREEERVRLATMADLRRKIAAEEKHMTRMAQLQQDVDAAVKNVVAEQERERVRVWEEAEDRRRAALGITKEEEEALLLAERLAAEAAVLMAQEEAGKKKKQKKKKRKEKK